MSQYCYLITSYLIHGKDIYQSTGFSHEYSTMFRENNNISSTFKQLKKRNLNIYHLKCFFLIDTNESL